MASGESRRVLDWNVLLWGELSQAEALGVAAKSDRALQLGW